MNVKMREMNSDEAGIVKSVSANGELRRRIRDMGIISSAEFTIVGRAPLNNPVAIRLKGLR